MYSSMFLTRRSLVELNCTLTRYIHSPAPRPLKDPRKFRLQVPRQTLNLHKIEEKFKANFDNYKRPNEHIRHRETMKKRFPSGWNPPRVLSREAMEGIRTLHQHDRKTFSTPVLAERFRISPEAVRRILKSAWIPNKEEKAKLLKRERKRKQENIAKRIERERADKWKQLDSHQKPEESKYKKRDQLSLV